jgi:cytochrome c peroxidase
MKSLCWWGILLFAFTSCTDKREGGNTWQHSHALFPPVIYPSDNQLNEKRIALGRKLFFDPILSRDYSVGCSNCHFPQFAFSDTVALSGGFHSRSGFRNAPPLQNLTWRSSFFKDGGIRSLELQVFAPLFDSAEMALDPMDLEKRLKRHPEYPVLFQEAYGRSPDFYALVRALASFERSLVSEETTFDRFLMGDDEVMSEDEKQGMKLFFSSRTSCSSCHSGILLSDDQFYNIGVGMAEDFGRYRITHLSSDSSKFRTPSLRNIRLTAPYMHDGSLTDLESVLEHYNDGGKEDILKDKRIRPLHLSKVEKEQLLSFLNCL